MAREVAALLRDPVYRGEGIRDAGGQPVVLIPGFLAGDDSLGVMTRWLRQTGHRTCSAQMRMNVSCSADAVNRLEARVEELFEKCGERVAVIGQSRGGCFARVLARRRPDLVSGIVTLGSPLTDQLAIHPVVKAQVYAVGALGTLGAPGLFNYRCLRGDCCEAFDDDLTARFPRGVGFVSIYSKHDGIVQWESCLDPAAKHVEIGASHIGMAVNPAGYREIAAALERFRRGERRREQRRGPRVSSVANAARAA
ncbi:MAG: alpha/beta hydrolase [Thermoleophilaceae bacterium]|nr:alpha/beta hydrolase [Thermoleophilaceae bacterium]